MIRIHRGPEPAALRPIRAAELARVRPLAVPGPLTREDLGRRYGEVRPALRTVQHAKCCYCERNNLEASFEAVEHYRPAIRARRGAAFPEHGYWWLAWTWRNLLFSCRPCNSAHKGDHFPLDLAGGALSAEETPPGAEQPLLIDPATGDPIRHIRFTHLPALPSGRWRPFPRDGSVRGDWTIRTLGLDRPDLLDLYDRHVAEYLRPVLDRLNEAVAERDRALAQGIWTKQALAWLKPQRPFAALSFDVFDQLVPRATRRRWGLSLRRVR